MNEKPVLGNLSPLIPAGENVDEALTFYEQKLGFTMIHKEGEPTEMAIVKRDTVEIFLCKSGDLYIAEQTSFRIHVDHVAVLYEEYQAKNVIHPNGQLDTKPWGTIEFGVLDLAGICITFYESVAR